MNYTIIGHTQGEVGYWGGDRDYDSDVPAKFDIKPFYEHEKEMFLKAWAEAVVENAYEDLVILLDGIPEDMMDEVKFQVFLELQKERFPFEEIVRAEILKAKEAEKERLAKYALEQARKIEKMQKDNDEAQFEILRKKLGK